MQIWYVITDNKGSLEAKFFATRDLAEEYAEENYYMCTGDVRPVRLEET